MKSFILFIFALFFSFFLGFIKKDSAVVKKNISFPKNNEKSYTSLKTLSQISRNILEMMFKYLPENEIVNSIEFFQKHVPYGRDKLKEMPQKWTKLFLDHRFYKNCFNYEITEYFYSKNNPIEYNSSFPILKIIRFKFSKNNIFTLILNKNGILEIESTQNHTETYGGTSFLSENWKENIFSINFQEHSIEILNTKLRLQVDLQFHFNEPQNLLQTHFNSHNVNPYIGNFIQPSYYLGYSTFQILSYNGNQPFLILGSKYCFKGKKISHIEPIKFTNGVDFQKYIKSINETQSIWNRLKKLQLLRSNPKTEHIRLSY